MPAGFVEGKQYAGTVFSKEFYSEDEPEVRISFKIAGHRLSPNAASNIHSILGRPTHNLDKLDIDSIRELLSEKASAEKFKMFFAKTEDHRGKKVLVIEGQFKELQMHSRTMYVDFDLQLAGSYSQEVTFQAPPKLFNKYFIRVMKSLKTIEWHLGSSFDEID